MSTVGAPDRIRGRAVEPTTLARRCTSILLTIALLAIPGAAAEATEVPDPEAEPPESLVEYFQEFRETAGFPSSRDLFVRSMTDASYSQDEFGVPLQLEEADEIHRRIEVQGMVDPSFVWSDSLEGAAGTYMDQGAGGVPTFLTTKDPHDIADLVAAHVPQGIDYRITQVEFSTEQLRAAKATIIGDFDELRRTGVQARSVALDVIRNRALVGVQALDAAAEQILRSRYGSIVSMREEPVRNLDHSTYPHDCDSRITCPPLKGGIKIYRTSDSGAICTAGFIVKLAGTSTLRVLTAGHCIDLNGGIGVGWSHHGVQFGTAQTETWGTGSDADAGLISVTVQGADNLVYASAANDIRAVEGYLTNAEQDAGDYVCRSAKATGYLCGTITVEDVDRDVDGKMIEHQWEVNFDASPGDSGASYFMYFDAIGIHSDSTDAAPWRSWYSPIGWVKTKLSNYGVPIDLCVSASC